MSIPLNKAVYGVVLAAALAAGCQNAQLAQQPLPEQPLLAGTDSQVEIPVLYPVRFTLRLQSGASGTLLPEDLNAQLVPLLEQLDKWQQVTRVVVVGHTDGEGSEQSNLLLSLRRANAMADKLVDFGTPEGALEVDGRGEQVPIADNNSISGKKLNRRIEVIAEGLVNSNQQLQLGRRQPLGE